MELKGLENSETVFLINEWILRYSFYATIRGQCFPAFTAHNVMVRPNHTFLNKATHLGTSQTASEITIFQFNAKTRKACFGQSGMGGSDPINQSKIGKNYV